MARSLDDSWDIATSVGAPAVVVALAPLGNVLALVVALAGVWAMGWHLVWQMARLDIDDPASCLRVFRANRDAGLVPVPFLACAAWLG